MVRQATAHSSQKKLTRSSIDAKTYPTITITICRCVGTCEFLYKKTYLDTYIYSYIYMIQGRFTASVAAPQY